MKILLVDDDALLRDMYATKFMEVGHSVEAVSSGERALEMLKDQDFDVVLLDIVMPTMTGIEFLQAAQKLSKEPAPKFIVLSNQGEEEHIDAAKKAGAAGYIVKAAMIPSEVVKKIESLIGGN